MALEEARHNNNKENLTCKGLTDASITEKEKERSPGEGDGGGVAYGGVGGVLHGAIGLYVANYLVRCVLDGAVVFDVAYGSVG